MVQNEWKQGKRKNVLARTTAREIVGNYAIQTSAFGVQFFFFNKKKKGILRNFDLSRFPFMKEEKDLTVHDCDFTTSNRYVCLFGIFPPERRTDIVPPRKPFP